MKTILVCNQKGGVGKSMIADELAYSFERSGIEISFYDLDVQGGTLHGTHQNDEAEVAIIDTPGALQTSLTDWLKAADLVIIPTRPTSRDIEPFLRMMQAVKTNTNSPVVYVVNAANRYRASSDFIEWIHSVVPEKDSILVIPQSEAVVQAGAKEISVIAHNKRAKVSKAVLDLANTVRQILGFEKE